MSDQFVGEIRMFPFNFAPNEWALCNGQLLAISSNTALFSILGTTYGGNGTTDFALPNLQGVSAAGMGNGPALTPLELGELDALASRTQAVPTTVTVARSMLTSAGTTQVAAVLPAEPTLVLNYCIALQGIFPARN